MIIRGGAVVTPEGVHVADIAVEDGQVAAVGAELPGGGEEIDARELHVFPGAIDAHVHFNEPGHAHWEGSATGSRALAAGGGAMYIDMPLNSLPCTVGSAELELKRAALEQSSITDFALWGGLVPGNRDRLAGLAEAGAIGFKAFMADSGLPDFPRADDRTLYEGMCEAARLGLPVAVHAENHEMVQARGGTAVRDFLDSRPVLAEVEAIHRAALLAREAGAKLHIVHISSGRGVAAALEERALGTDISLETCAHYLYFTAADMERMGPVLKCAPPLRPETLPLDGIDIVASDHSPAPPSMKTAPDFFRVWGGVAGVQHTLAVVLSRTGAAHASALLAANPARRFGLERKGRIEPGYDADFALVDLGAQAVVTRQSLFQRHGFTPYLGATFRGVVRRTILRGETIFEDGKITAQSCGKMVRHAETRLHP